MEKVESGSYDDAFDDFEAFLMPRIEAALRCLTPDGSLFVHLDSREVHYVKVALDGLLGRDRFMNEIIWAYDYGGRPKNRWPAKHDTILWYALDPDDYVFDFDAMDRIPYMAPGLVSTREGRARQDADRRLVAHHRPDQRAREDRLPDAEAAGRPEPRRQGALAARRRGPRLLRRQRDDGRGRRAHGRGFVLVDESPEAVEVAAARLAAFEPELVGFAPQPPTQTALS